jgi:hypothetical protein
MGERGGGGTGREGWVGRAGVTGRTGGASNRQPDPERTATESRVKTWRGVDLVPNQPVGRRDLRLVAQDEPDGGSDRRRGCEMDQTSGKLEPGRHGLDSVALASRGPLVRPGGSHSDVTGLAGQSFSFKRSNGMGVLPAAELKAKRASFGWRSPFLLFCLVCRIGTRVLLAGCQGAGTCKCWQIASERRYHAHPNRDSPWSTNQTLTLAGRRSTTSDH